VATLHRAVALAQVDGILVLVGQDLDLDVARVLQELLHVDRRVAEGSPGFGLGHLHRIDQRRLGVHHPHAATAAAAGGLDDDGITNALGRRPDLRRIVGQLTLGTRHARHTGLDHGLLGRDLVTHDADRLGRRANELKTGLLDALGKVGVLAQEAIAGVNGFSIGHLGSRDDGRHVEVALRGRPRADTDGFVSQLDVFGLFVRLGVDHHGRHPQLTAGALDAQRDLAAVGDQNFLEHGLPWFIR